jgi:hypothetical protein
MSAQHTNELDVIDSSKIEWNSNLDQLLANWCDQAKCFEWMHTESCSYCQTKAKYFMLLLNCLTAFSGLSNIFAGSYIYNGFQISWLFGSISIFISTLNILQDKLGYSQQSIVHKKLANSWSVIISKIEELIILPYVSRQDCKTFLKYIKADINQAKLEGSSLLSKYIRASCYEKFKSVQGFDIPDICGQMEHTRVFHPKLPIEYTTESEPLSIQAPLLLHIEP